MTHFPPEKMYEISRLPWWPSYFQWWPSNKIWIKYTVAAFYCFYSYLEGPFDFIRIWIEFKLGKQKNIHVYKPSFLGYTISYLNISISMFTKQSRLEVLFAAAVTVSIIESLGRRLKPGYYSSPCLHTHLHTRNIISPLGCGGWRVENIYIPKEHRLI